MKIFIQRVAQHKDGKSSYGWKMRFALMQAMSAASAGLITTVVIDDMPLCDALKIGRQVAAERFNTMESFNERAEPC